MSKVKVGDSLITQVEKSSRPFRIMSKAEINKCINKMSTIPKKKYHNPYYKKNSINNAIQIIKKFDYKQNLIKDFYDTF